MSGAEPGVLIIGCDESGSEGETLVASQHPVFVHASVVPVDLAADVPSLVSWLAERETKTQTTQKVVTFIEDYRQALRAAEARLRPGGFTFLTLGERRVDGASVPLVTFTREILESAGHTHVASIRRLLPTRKRMAVRNTAGRTMLEETVLIMQKQG